MAALRALLVLTFTLDYLFHATVLIIVSWTVGITAAYAYLKYQPYYHAVVNRAFAACAFVFCWACICLSMLQIRSVPEVCG